MAIRKRGSGWQIDYFDPTGKRVRKSFAKKKDAEAELAKRVSLIAEKRYLDVKKDYTTTLEQILAKYEENFSDQTSFGNWKKFCLERFREYFGKNTRLDNIRYVDIETYQKHLKRLPTMHGTVRTVAAVNREMSVLRHVFSKAVEWEMIENNPFKRGKSLILKENNTRVRYLTEDEIKRLLAECPKYLRRIVVCALNTGMRQGEILPLRWDQVREGFIYLRKTKTKEPREIPINPAMDELYREIKAEQPIGTAQVFLYATGEALLIGAEPIRKRKGPEPAAKRVKSIEVGFNAAPKRPGIEDFHFHDLRHTFASHMVMRGASLKEIQEILGHKTMTMTLRYARPWQEHKKKAVCLLNGLTSGATVTKVSQVPINRRR